MDKSNHTKKHWSAPELTVYGSVTEITRQNKDFGPSDGLAFQGNPIGNAS